MAGEPAVVPLWTAGIRISLWTTGSRCCGTRILGDHTVLFVECIPLTAFCALRDFLRRVGLNRGCMLADLAEFGAIGSILFGRPSLNFFLDCAFAVTWVGMIAQELRPMPARCA